MKKLVLILGLMLFCSQAVIADKVVAEQSAMLALDFIMFL